ncbi:MAG: hypothetical protein A2Z72_02950 [Omnitrophica bacterium RBG_13_46_9]|nr:MAG: hypothetical protein A2Z72_02950 [Omnitrophica bacterium RBG_13_46_9]
MRIALVYPSISESGFNSDERDILFNHIHPGLCHLSAVCKKEGFGDITLIDLRVLRDWNEFRKTVETLVPDVVGITSMSPDFGYAVRCAEIIKEVDPGIKTIIGGMHPTVKTEEAVENDKIDYIITGEGEIAFPKLLLSIKEGRVTDRVIKGERPDVDILPFIDRELFDCLEMPYDFFLPLPFMTILAGRGCNYSCKFCSPATKIMHGPRIRQRSVDSVIEELRYLRDTYGLKSFMFWDDCFTEDKNWVMAFCERYEKDGFEQPFVCQTRADIICENVDMMKRLKDAGLAMASIGFESGNNRILSFINKGTTVIQNLKAADICKRLGIKIWAYNMFGFPTETNSEAFDTAKMIRKIRPYRSSAAFFTPHPGSFFYDYCKKHDLNLIGEHDDFVRFPEIDRAKIKEIDYEFMRKMAIVSKKPTLGVKIRIKAEKIFSHKRNKPFKVRFQAERRREPSLNKMTLLRLTHQAGRI